MNNILIFSQDGNFTGYCRSIAIGQRQEDFLIGDKLKELLDKGSIVLDDLIHALGNSYRDSITRAYNNQEIPKKQLVDKLVKYFEVDDDYFRDKNLRNVIITDGGVIVGTYSTNEKAEEVKKQLDIIVEEQNKSDRPAILHIPKENE